MKHITFADKNFLVGDGIADAILEYAAALGEMRSADSIDINAIGPDGDDVQATLFLSTGVPLVAETTTSRLPEPDNDETFAYIEARLAQHVDPAPLVLTDTTNYDDCDTPIQEWVTTQD